MKRWPVVWLCGAVMLGLPAGLRPQNPDCSSSVVGPQSAGVVVAKPVRKPDQVITNDPIALLSVKRPPLITATTAPVAPIGAKEETAIAGESAKKGAEIAALEQQIKDKQKRITLLMRLFVKDEQEFLKNPSGAADPFAEERRKYEQDELRWETAELAKMRERLNALNGPK